MLLEFKVCTIESLAALLREIVLNFLELRMTAQKDPELVLDGFWLNLHLAHRPAVDIPAQIDHAVLLQQVIIELIRGNKTLVVRGLVVDLNSYPAGTVLQHEVGIAAVLIDVIEVILRIKVSRLLCAEGLAE